VTNATYLAEDEGERSWRELDLPFTKSAATAQRIAKIELERARQQISVVWPGKLTCYRAQPGDVVQITFAMLGWSAKPYEVVGGGLALETDADGQPILGSDLVLRETASSVFDWNSGEETTVDPAPDTNLPDPFTVGVPGTPVVIEELYETRGGRGVGSKASITYVAAADASVEFYQVEYRPVGAAAFAVQPQTEDTTYEIFDIAPGHYDFRVKAISEIGVSSAYSTASNVEIFGLGARPAAPTGVSAQPMGGLAVITLDQHAELDVLRGGRILVRHSEASASQSWEESVSVGNQESWPGDSVVIFVPLKPGSYLLKARDSSGQESEGFAAAVTKQASALTFTTLATTLQEDSTFTGTKTGCVLSGSVLELDTIAGAVIEEGLYEFAVGFDFSSVVHARITGQIEGVVSNVTDLIDSRTDNIDQWLSFDGNAGIGSGADAWIEARETDDDPAGAPTWSQWKRIDAAEFVCRGMQFRLQLRSFDPILNIGVDILRVKADTI
jgi:hypothetical protein